MSLGDEMPFAPVVIQIEIITPDQLRKIVFTLISTQGNDQAENWTIDFEVWECNDPVAAFQLIGKVAVVLSPEDFDGARTIAKNQCLCNAQAAQALAAADTLKASHYGTATTDDVRSDVVQIVHAE